MRRLNYGKQRRKRRFNDGEPDYWPLDDEKSLRSSRRVELPMLIEGKPIISRPDSGSEENIIAADVVSSLHLKMDSEPEHQRDFRLANGALVKALGRILILCSFARDRTVELYSAFYVFKQLICPILMGMPFLDQTETLVKYRHRLQARTAPSYGPLQLSSLNSPRQRLYCLVNSLPKFANADTGSEVDLLSLKYVHRRAFHIAPVDLRSSTVAFADGSTADLIGKVTVDIVLGTPEGPRLLTTFYVLEGLTCDILFGEDFLEETKAFKAYRNAFTLVDHDDDVAEVSGIVWFNTSEARLSKGLGALSLAKSTDSGKPWLFALDFR